MHTADAVGLEITDLHLVEHGAPIEPVVTLNSGVVLPVANDALLSLGL